MATVQVSVYYQYHVFMSKHYSRDKLFMTANDKYFIGRDSPGVVFKIGKCGSTSIHCHLSESDKQQVINAFRGM